MRALIVLIAALLSAPAFGDSHMARNLGFGMFDPTPIGQRDGTRESIRSQMPSDAPRSYAMRPPEWGDPQQPPPLPRPRPEQEAYEAWLKTPEGRAEADRLERELEERVEERLATPEGRAEMERIRKITRDQVDI